MTSKITRFPDFLDHVRRLPCVACEPHKYAERLNVRPGLERVCDPHHTETGGMGMKASDLSCVSLCRTHHRLVTDVAPSLLRELHERWQFYFDNLWQIRVKTLESYLEIAGAVYTQAEERLAR